MGFIDRLWFGFSVGRSSLMVYGEVFVARKGKVLF